MPKLPVNVNTKIRSYAYDAFTNLIADNEMTTNLCLACFWISMEECDYEMVYQNVTVLKKEQDISVYGKPYETDMELKITKDVQVGQEIVLFMKRHTIAHTRSRLEIHFSGVRMDNGKVESWWIERCAGGKCSYFENGKEQNLVMNRSDKYEPYYIKFLYQEQTVLFQYSRDNVDWIELGTVNVQLKNYSTIQWEIRILCPGYMYYDWLFSNYIQLQYDSTYGLPLEHTSLTRKSFSYYTANALLDYARIEHSFLCFTKKSLVEFTKMMIDTKKYLEVELDEFYVQGTCAQKAQFHFSHQNLIYGYDDEKEVIYCISFIEGKLNETVIRMEDYEVAYQSKRRTSCFYILEHEYDWEVVHFKLDHFLAELKEYLESTVSVRKYGGCTDSTTNISGIKIYDAILYDADYQKLFLNDIRISYILYEHKK
ncbi:hypothetical protein [[Clostridium] polysaccharolyticum]|uniref:Uncharacterized protein n=1 Tax=[Clostridium] polysaccharolyticum TaxID=29364 RepID=A0A1I0C5A6_9FIRM|nr:hypothetical protein [[Clostridium] polysaccharolyticum]SET14494.1 hypothetical protein SAMN04487772_10924 [[Clostridium] polysaccharolyticum]